MVTLSTAWKLFLGRVKVEEGLVNVSGFFELAGKILYGILFLLCAASKGFFSAQQIFLLFTFPPKPFVAVEPLDIFQFEVFVNLVEEAVAEAYSGENSD